MHIDKFLLINLLLPSNIHLFFLFLHPSVIHLLLDLVKQLQQMSYSLLELCYLAVFRSCSSTLSAWISNHIQNKWKQNPKPKKDQVENNISKKQDQDHMIEIANHLKKWSFACISYPCICTDLILFTYHECTEKWSTSFMSRLIFSTYINGVSWASVIAVSWYWWKPSTQNKNITPYKLKLS
jgi:hypothetical protein